LRNLFAVRVRNRRRNRAFLRAESPFAEFLEARVLLTGGHTGSTNDPGEFYYSLSKASTVYNSDHSDIWVDDSDIVRLTIEDDGSWHHQIYFDGSDAGLTHWKEDIDAFAIRQDGSLLISTVGRANVAGVYHSTGGDLLRFTPTSLGEQTRGDWELYVNGDDVGISHGDGIDAVSELTDGRLIISTKTHGYLPGIGHVRSEDLSELTLTSTGPRTQGTWNRYFDGSDTGLEGWRENIDAVSVSADGSSIHLSTKDAGRVPHLNVFAEGVITYDASQLGDQTAGRYRHTPTLNPAFVGIPSWNDIDAFHVANADPDGQQPPVIDEIADQTIDELVPFSYQVAASGTGGGVQNIDFEAAPGGITLSGGDILLEQFAAMGIHFTSHDPANHPPMIFDSSNPTGGDYDLGTPNAKFGGPGTGNGGKSGRWKNDIPRQNILIISEDGDSLDPDDNAHGGKLILTFDSPTAIDDIGLLDIDSGHNTIELYDVHGERISTTNIPRRGDNSHQIIALNAVDVSRLELNLAGSGAITDLIFCRDGSCPTGGGPLTYTLAAEAPAGMTISDTGRITWTPTEAQGPGVYDVTVEVSDGVATATETFAVTVAEVNVAPVLEAIGSQTIAEGDMFSLQAVASDSDVPVNVLTYHLIGTPPSGMSIGSSGLITWTPTEVQGPDSYEVSVEVSDGDLSDVQTFTIVVTELNQPPVLAAIGNQSVIAGESLTFTATAADADIPDNTLLYAISGDVPPEATFDSATGRFVWNSSLVDTAGDLTVTITVDDQAGGSDSETFTITVLPPPISSITLVENDRFQTTATQSLTIPVESAYFEFEILELSFDADAEGKISDAFEVALVDGNGDSLVHTISAGRDAFLNISEPGAQASGANTVVMGTTVRVDLSHIPAGTPATVIYRLVNNDNADGIDRDTTVTVTEGQVVVGDLNTSPGVSVASRSRQPQGSLDLTGLTDITGSLTFTYQQTSFNDDTNTLFADVLITNNSSQPVDGPFVLVVQNITDPLVVVSDIDGTTPTGDRYYLLDDLSGTNTILPGAQTLAGTLTFINPAEGPFDYRLTVLADPNESPTFTSSPVTLVEAGRPYEYDSNADDPDGDTLTYELLLGPATMTIDALTGNLQWSPESDELGNHSVRIRVSDGRGAFDEQQFTVEVRDVIPNRPPIIISSPVTQTTLVPEAASSAEATLNFIELTPSDVGSASTTAFSTLPSEDAGLFGLNFTNVQSVNFDVDPYGNPIADGSFITTQYESLGLVMNNFQVSSSVYGGPASAPNTTNTPAVPGEVLEFQFIVPVLAVGFINTSPDQDVMQFLDSEGSVIFSTRDQDSQASPNFDIDRFLGVVADSSRPISSVRVINSDPNGVGRLELDELVFVPMETSYQYQVEAVDPDFDPIAYELTDAPSGMIINANTGLISWRPGSDDVGTHTVTVTAVDGQGGSATQEYQLAVLADPTNTAPVITTTPVEELFIPGFSNPASGQVTPQRISLDIGNGETFDGTVSITLADQADRFADIVLAVDESGSMAGDQAWVAEMIPLLDDALKAQGIGITAQNPNRFAIVGFGGGREGITVGHFLNQQQSTKYTLYGPDNEVVASGLFNEVVPDELLNLQLPDDGRYVLIVEAADTNNLTDGIDIGIEGSFSEGVRQELLQLGRIVDDRLHTPGQPVEYSFTLGTQSLLYFDSLEKDPRIHWTLSGPTGTVVSRVNFDQSDVSLSNPVHDLPAGTYTLTIDSDTDFAADYRFRMLNLHDAQQLASSATFSQTFVEQNETLAYRFLASAGQQFELQTPVTAAHGGSIWRLIGPDGLPIELSGTSTALALGTNLRGLELPATGQYYLLLEAAQSPRDGNNAIRVPSVVELNLIVSDPAAPAPILPGNTVNGVIEFVGDFEEYSFTVASRSTMYVDSLSDSAITWMLSGPAGSRPAVRFNATDSVDSADPVLNLVAGDYTIRVDSNGQTGAFAFRLVDLADATPVTPGSIFSDQLTIPAETDAYRFTASTGDELYIDVVSASDSVNSEYKLYSQYGDKLFESNRLNDSGPISITADGTYVLLVEGRYFNADQDSYSINIVPVTSTIQALTPGTVTNGTLTTAAQSAVYTFTLAADTHLYFDSLTQNSGLLWSLEGPRGLEISSQRLDLSDSLDRADVSIDARAGDYQLSVFGSADAVGDFRFALLDLQNPAHTTLISPNPGAAAGSVSVTPQPGLDSRQTQVFRFTADAGDELSFVTSVSGSINSYYRVLDQNGTEVVPRTALATDQLNEVFTLGGEYYLLIEPRISNADVDTWSIDINWVQNNGSVLFAGTPLVFGSTVSGSLSAAGQVDAYTFTLGDRTTTYFDSLTDSGTIRWNLIGPTGAVVSSRTFSASDSFNLADVTGELVAGDYLLEVFAGSGTPGAYSFRFHDTATAAEITPGIAFSNTLDPANETHLYRFEASAGDRFYFDVESASDSTNTLYKLVDPFGRRIFTSNRLNDFGPQQVDLTGTYTLLVEAWRANTGTDTYTINVLPVPATLRNAMTVGETITDLLTVNGQTAEYTFSVSDYTQVSFDSLTNSATYNWTLSSDTATYMQSRRFDQSHSVSIGNPVIELKPGNYTLTVANTLAGNTQDFSFRLLDLATALPIDMNSILTGQMPAGSNSSILYQFTAQPGDIVYFDALHYDSGFTQIPYWNVIDEYGREIVGRGLNSDQGPQELAGGTYTVIVEGRDNDTGINGNYSFEIVQLDNAITPAPPVVLLPGNTVNASIDRVHETDRYSLSLVDDSLLYFDSLTNDSSLTWSIRNSSGSTLISNRRFDLSDSGGTASPVINLKAGIYTVSVTSSEAEAYSFRLLNLHEATAITPGVSFTGEFVTSNQTDLYQFSGQAGEQIFLDVISDIPASNAYMRLADRFGNIISTQTSLTDQDLVVLPRTETYYLLVEARANNTANNTYELNVISATTTEFQLSPGDIRTGSIAGVGDTTEYSFSLPGRATLYFDSLTNSSSLVWSLVGPGGAVITNQRFDQSDSFNDETPLMRDLPAGDYRLTVDGTGDAVEDFSFRLLDIAANGTLIDFDTVVSDELTLPNETDVYRFTATAGTTILVDILAADDTNNTLYRVFDPLGNEILEIRDLVDGETGPLTATGTYTLLVEGWRGNTGLDTYQFNLSNNTTRTRPVNVGDLVSDAITTPGEQTTFTFEVTGDRFLYLDSLTDDAAINWSLTGPSGQIVSQRRFDRSDSTDFASPVFETPAGRYELTVDGNLDTTGGFAFRLLDVADAVAFSLPAAMGNSVPVSGTLAPGNSTNLYRFNAAAGDNISLESISETSANAYYRVVDPFGRTLFTRVLSGDQLNVSLDVSGTYTLLVEGRRSATADNVYELNVVFNGNTPSTPLTGSSLSLGFPQSGSLTTTSQVDSYQFTLTDRTLIHMDVQRVFNGTGFDPVSSTVRWSLRGPRGNEVVNRAFTQTDSQDSTTSNLDLVAGTYQLDIFAGSGTPGAYLFTLHDLGDAVPVTPGTVITDELTNPAESDLYQFTAEAGDQFLFDFTVAGSPGAEAVKLIDRYGTVIERWNNLTDRDDVTIPRSGTYTLLVEGRYTNSAADPYDLNIIPVTSVPDALPTGSSVTDGINLAGQTRAYSFTVSSPSLLGFLPQTVSSQVNWMLYSEAGTFAEADFDEGTKFANLPVGDYTIVVDGAGDYIGPADFTVLIADQANILPDSSIVNSQLTTANAVEIYQFDAVAGQHFSLLPDLNLQFADATTSSATAGRFVASADPEDGWSGMDVARRADVFRDGAAINYIVVTDEDRDIQDDNLSFEFLFGELSDQGALLNVVVNPQFRDVNNDRVLGVDSEGNAYKADGAGGFTVTSGGSALNPQVSVKQDYIDLAWALDGAAWDLGLLRAGGITAESFTNAFVSVKVAEILEQTSLRLSASDPDAKMSFVAPVDGRYDDIVGGQTYDFDIQIDSDGNPRSFDLLFRQGPTIGSIPVYIVAPYGYNAAAFDADGDILTWSVAEGPDGLVVDPATGILTWPADSVVYGQHTVTLRVEDGRGGFDEQSFNLDVNGGQPASISGTVFDQDVLNGSTPVNILENGGFEADVSLNGQTFVNISPGSEPAGFGWTVDAGDIDVGAAPVEPFILYSAYEGTQALDLNGFQQGSISQEFVTVPGATYTLSFQYADNPFEAGISSADVLVQDIGTAGTLLNQTIQHSTSSNAPINADWTAFTATFVATGERTRLSFASTSASNSPSGGIILDDVSVAPAAAFVLDTLVHEGTGYFLVGGSESGDGITWADALVFARSIGSSLAKVDSQELNDLLYNTWGSSDSVYGLWIGLTDRAEEGVFYWEGHGTAPAYTNWSPGEPNQFNSLNEDWVLIYGDGQSFGTPGRWNDSLDGTLFNGASFYAVVEIPGIAERTVYLDNNRNGLRDSDEAFTTTDVLGNYQFTNLNAGTYNTRLEPVAGWKTVSPDTGQVDVALDSGEQRFAVDFITQRVPVVNTNPLFISSPTLQVVAGQDYRYIPVVDEFDGDILTFDLPLSPAGMAVNSNNGTIFWTPRFDQIGLQNVLLRVRDGNGGFDLQYFSVEVKKPNTAPVISSDPPLGPAGTALPFTYSPVAVDAENDALTWSLTAAPAGATIDSDTGIINWTPAGDQLGTQLFEVTVRDQAGLSAVQAFDVSVQVNPVNSDPTITSQPPLSVWLGDRYTYAVTANDQNGDPLTISLDIAPAGMSINSDGFITWEPTPGQFGDHTVRVLVDDGRGGAITQEYTLTVETQPINLPPSITSVPLTFAVAGQPYRFAPNATDPNGDALFWLLEESPDGMSVNRFTGQLDWIPSTADIGQHTVTMRVIDPLTASALLTYTLRVSAVNTPPIILSTPPTSGAVGATYLYQVAAQDADQDADQDVLTYSLIQGPPGMTVNAQTGRVQWTPGVGQDGTSPVEIRVSDSAGATVTQQFSIVVAGGQPNQLPVITSTPAFFAGTGDIYEYDVEASDPELDTLSYALLQSPVGMTIDSATGHIEWTPAAGDTGTTVVEVLVTDPSGGGSLQTYSLTVLAANNLPVISSMPPTTLAAGVVFRYDVLATDADGEFLTYELVSGPDGMLIDGVGRMFWIPTAAQLGNNDVEVRVTDQRGGSVSQTFTVTVQADTAAPQVAILLSRNPVNVGAFVDIRVSAVDNVGIDSLLLTIDGQPVPLDANGTARVQPHSVGALNALATATDAAGNVATDQITLFVADPDDVEGPVLVISTPTDGGRVTAVADIVGTVNDDTLVEYRVLVAEFGTDSFRQIASGSSNVTNDVLGQIDPTLLANGTYILRLEAEDAGGRFNAVQQLIEVAGDLKLGNFRIAFTDITVPIAGIPVGITRIYDTLEASRESDFGYGWRLDYRDTKLQVGVPATGLEHMGIYSPLREGVRVYLNIPGQGRQGFTFTPEIRILPGFGDSLVLARPRFTADDGVQATLSVASTGYLQVNPFGELYASGGIPYNPASPDFGGRWVLTTQDGTVYNIDGSTGQLTTATDLDGNRIDFTESGIFSSRGESIQFERDARGRITAVVDPQGHRIRYEYSLQGDLIRVTDRDGNTNELQYDSPQPHYLTGIVDGRGVRVMQVEFDPVTGRMTGVAGPSGRNVVDYPLIVPGLPAGYYVQQAEDSLGRLSELVFDDRGNVVRQMELFDETPDTGLSVWKVSVYDYDASGNQTAVYAPFSSIGLNRYTDQPAELRSSRTFNDLGYVTQETDALGNTRYLSYDRSGNLLAETDPLGNTTSYTYDDRRMLTSITDQLGNVTRMTSNSRGDVTAIVKELRDGSTVTVQNLSYDQLGLVTAAVSTSGATQNFLNEDSGDLTLLYYHWEDPDDDDTLIDHTVVTRNIYNANDQVIRTLRYTLPGEVTAVSSDDLDAITPDSDVVTGYDGAGRITASTDQSGRTTSYLYDAAGNLIEVRVPSVDATGTDRIVTERITRNIYDAQGQLIFAVDEFTPETNEEVRGTQYFYDELGRETESRRIRHVQTELQPDPDHPGLWIAVVTNEDSLETLWVTTTEYDVEDRVVETRSPTGLVSRFSYDAAGQLVAQTQFVDLNRNGIIDGPTEELTSTFEYDAAGNQIRATAPTGVSTEFVYDAASRQIRQRMPNGTTLETLYDEQNRVVQTTDAQGRITRYEYDESSNLIRTLLPELTDGTQHVYEYRYDLWGNRVAVIDPNGNETRFGFDEANRQVSMALPLDVLTGQVSQTVTFDVTTGQPISTTDTEGVRVEFEYENSPAGGRVLTSTQYFQSDLSTEPAATINVSYDGLGRVSQIDDSEFGTTVYVYSPEGFVVQTIDPTGITGYEYDAFGNQTAIETELTRLEYEYDELSRLVTASVVRRDGQPVAPAEITQYRYGRNGSLELQIQPNGIVSRYGYDEFDRMVSLYHYYPDATPETLSDNQIAASFEYSLDVDGTWIGLVESRDGGTDGTADDYVTAYVWEYDALSRLTYEDIQGFDAAGAPIAQSMTWILDGAGNRLQSIVDINLDGTADRETTFTFDDNNRIVSELVHDLVANTSELTVHSYRGSLPVSKITYAGTDTSAPVLRTVSYMYDVRSRLIQIVSTEGGVSVTTDFTLDTDGDRVRQTISSDGTVQTIDYRVADVNPTGYAQVIEQTTDSKVQTSGIGLDVFSEAKAGETPVILIYDPHGSTRLLTNPDALVTQAFVYDAFGNPLGFDPANAGTTLLYNGEQTDASGLQYLRARYYDPALGRMLTPDPVAPRPGQLHTFHAYQYANHAPTLRIDPSGAVDFTLIGQQVTQFIENGLKKKEIVSKIKASRIAAKGFIVASYALNLAYSVSDPDTTGVASTAAAYHLFFQLKYTAQSSDTWTSFQIGKMATIIAVIGRNATKGLLGSVDQWVRPANGKSYAIKIKPTGFPDYTDHLYNGNRLLNAIANHIPGVPGFVTAALSLNRARVFLPYQGSRSRDKRVLGLITGLGQGSRTTFTWHHHEVIGIHEAVKYDPHKRPHAGGVLYWEVAMKKRYG
jgi:RHS repeat-associated protein